MFHRPLVALVLVTLLAAGCATRDPPATQGATASPPPGEGATLDRGQGAPLPPSPLPPPAPSHVPSPSPIPPPAPALAAPTPTPPTAPPAGPALLLPHVNGTPKITTSFTAFLGRDGGGGDSSIAVSNDTIVAMDQNHVGIFLRNGSIIARSTPWDLDRPKLPANQSISDPRVSFDVDSGRFFAIGESAPLGGCVPNTACANLWIIAVSKSSSPRSLTPADWDFWAFDATLTEGQPSGLWGDFAFVQFDARNVIVTGQMIAHTTEGPISIYDRVWVFNKTTFLRGETIEGPAKDYHDILDPATGKVLINRFIPASHVGDADGVFLAHFGADDCDLVIGKVTGDAPNASLVVRNVAIPGTCRGNRVVGHQLGDARGINTQPHIVSSPVYVHGDLWIVQVVPAIDPTGIVDALRLVRLNVSAWPATPTVEEDSRLHVPGTSLDYPALAVSPHGDITIVLNEFNASAFPTAAIVGRLAGEPAGSFHPVVPFAPGGGRHDYPGSGDVVLFGDFATATLDPSTTSAWVIAENTERTCEWGERVAQVVFADGGAPDAPIAPRTSAPNAPCSATDASASG